MARARPGSLARADLSVAEIKDACPSYQFLRFLGLQSRSGSVHTWATIGLDMPPADVGYHQGRKVLDAVGLVMCMHAATNVLLWCDLMLLFV